ncbi:hypothetical protein NL676_008930 [Syzygium grande]|nr:hypothetical protein NL676_008930 [Syzygium grande]
MGLEYEGCPFRLDTRSEVQNRHGSMLVNTFAIDYRIIPTGTSGELICNLKATQVQEWAGQVYSLHVDESCTRRR